MTTTDTGPQTKAGRALIDVLPPTWWPVIDGTFARKVRAIEAEARRLTVERLRATLWPDGFDGRECLNPFDIQAALTQEETRA